MVTGHTCLFSSRSDSSSSTFFFVFFVFSGVLLSQILSISCILNFYFLKCIISDGFDQYLDIFPHFFVFFLCVFFQQRPVIPKFILHLHQSAQMQVSTSYIYNFIIELIHIFPTLQTFLMNFDSSLFFNGDCFHFWNHCSQSISVSNNLISIFVPFFAI